MCKGDHLEGHVSHNGCMSAFIEILQEPKFQVLESEYHLSRRLSLVCHFLHFLILREILLSDSLLQPPSPAQKSQLYNCYMLKCNS